jgi:hypothetical protein
MKQIEFFIFYGISCIDCVCLAYTAPTQQDWTETSLSLLNSY